MSSLINTIAHIRVTILPEVNEAVLDIIVLQQDKVDPWFTSTRTFEQHMFHMKVLVVRNTNFGIR